MDFRFTNDNDHSVVYMDTMEVSEEVQHNTTLGMSNQSIFPITLI